MPNSWKKKPKKKKKKNTQKKKTDNNSEIRVKSDLDLTYKTPSKSIYFVLIFQRKYTLTFHVNSHEMSKFIFPEK